MSLLSYNRFRVMELSIHIYYYPSLLFDDNKRRVSILLSGN